MIGLTIGGVMFAWFSGAAAVASFVDYCQRIQDWRINACVSAFAGAASIAFTYFALTLTVAR